MSIVWSIVLVVAVFFLLLFVLLLFIPFYFVVDSREKRFSVRWFLLNVAYRFSDKQSEIGLAGMRFGKKKRPAPAPTAPAPAPEEKTVAEERGEERPSFISILLSHRSLVIHLAELAIKYLLGLLRAFSIKHLSLDLSFDDQMINGICYGAFQGVRIKRVHLGVNFWGENRFVGEFSLPLYRMVIPTLRLLFRIPYMEVYRVLREIRHPGSVRKEEVSA